MARLTGQITPTGIVRMRGIHMTSTVSPSDLVETLDTLRSEKLEEGPKLIALDSA